MTIHLILFFLLCAGVTGAFFYRGRGGNLIDLPRPLEQLLFCIVFGVVMQTMGVPVIAHIVAMGIAVAAACTGHGQYFLALSVESSSGERLDFILRPIFGPDPRKKFHDMGWRDDTMTPEQKAEIAQAMMKYGMEKLFYRCLSGMALTGLAISIAPGIAIAMYGHVISGILIGLSGASKALAYYVSHQAGKGTEGGEWGYGALQWLIPVAVLFMEAGLFTP